MGSYTTNFFWDKPKPVSNQFDYSGGMINTPDTPETLNFPADPQLNKMSIFPDIQPGTFGNMWDKVKGWWGDPQAQDVSYPTRISDRPFSDMQYADTGGVHGPATHPRYGLGAISPQGYHPSVDQTPWRENIDINRLSEYPEPWSPHVNDMRNVAGEVGEYSQIPGQGNVEMVSPRKGFKLPSIMEGLGAIKNMIPNPLNPESKNYNPRLQGQVDELNARRMLGDVSWNDAGRIIGDNPLAGQNLVSGFGTNDYEEMLQKRIDYFNKQKAKKGKRFTDEQQRRLDAAIAEKQRKDDASRAAQVSDRAKIEAHTGRPMSQYRRDRPASERRFTGHGRSGMGRDPSDRMAYGGRVGYKTGGRVGILAVF